ncbi:MAG TPA: response regulator transcription factor, partial [Cytophagales bacterium]|nr:response regulator transcription factor [Cytophagales bacterium]
MTLDGKRVVIVEDNKGLRDGFELLINASGKHQVVNTHESAERALEALELDKPEIVLMDVNLPGINGIKCTHEIKKLRPKTEILIITVFENSTLVFDALCAGASGYLTKNSSPVEILSAIDSAAMGGAPMSQHIARMVVDSFKKNSKTPLTVRETDILTLLSNGKSYATIADNLNISKETV